MTTPCSPPLRGGNSAEIRPRVTRKRWYLDRAIQIGSLAPLDYEKLADLLRQAGRPAEAIAILKKGIGVNPYSQRLYKALALVYISQKLYKDAMDAMQKELEIFLEDSFMRMLLAKARATPSP